MLYYYIMCSFTAGPACCCRLQAGQTATAEPCCSYRPAICCYFHWAKAADTGPCCGYSLLAKSPLPGQGCHAMLPPPGQASAAAGPGAYSQAKLLLLPGQAVDAGPSCRSEAKQLLPCQGALNCGRRARCSYRLDMLPLPGKTAAPIRAKVLLNYGRRAKLLLPPSHVASATRPYAATAAGQKLLLPGC